MEEVEETLMKYMTFNSSCSYAGIANMLERHGLDTSDRSIAIGMKLPYLFFRCNGIYLSGPMLQEAKWFNLYLNPIGYELSEKMMLADEAAAYLKAQESAMLGIRTGNTGKHAVVYTGTRADRLVFLNNKWESEEAPDEIQLTADELKQKLDPMVVVATLRQVSPKSVSFTDKLQESIAVLQANLAEITELCGKEETVAFFRSKLNILFRPLFLDGIAMLNLVGEAGLAQSFTSLQQELLCALRQEPEQCILLNEYISMDRLQTSAQSYVDLIKAEMEREVSYVSEKE